MFHVTNSALHSLQLDNTNAGDNMVGWHREKSCINQAGDVDYKNNTVFNRGHLLPSSYGLAENKKKSTFTLTNIVPQVITFNGGRWAKMESCVKCVLNEYCNNNNNEKEGFVVIGAQPSNGMFLNNRINIPSMLWSAFCCYSSSEDRWLASAHWGENVQDNNTHLQTKTLADLQCELGGQFNVFPGTQCPLDTTVSEFYPHLNAECHCPSNNI